MILLYARAPTTTTRLTPSVMIYFMTFSFVCLSVCLSTSLSTGNMRYTHTHMAADEKHKTKHDKAKQHKKKKKFFIKPPSTSLPCVPTAMLSNPRIEA